MWLDIITGFSSKARCELRDLQSGKDIKITKGRWRPTIKVMATSPLFGSNLSFSPDCSNVAYLKGVPTELFTYPGKGHGFIAPQDNYAMMLQVYRWFCHYLLGEELDFFRDDF